MIGVIECTERMCEDVYRGTKHDTGHHSSRECGYSEPRATEPRLRFRLSGIPTQPEFANWGLGS